MRVRQGALALGVALTAALGATLSGCTTTSQVASGAASANPADPWEGTNRKIYAFNDEFDRGIARPVAEFYTFITPAPARHCVHNIFANLGDVWSAFNSLLQGRGHDFVNTLGRVLLNTTMGVGGCFDVHTKNNGVRIRNDFGTTLGVWGIGSGPYVVLPLLGPATLRDGVGMAADFANPVSVGGIHDVPVRNSLRGVQAVDTRANLLGASKLLDATALDPYSFTRDAYLQRRNEMVWRRTGEASTLPDYGDDEDYDDEPHESEHADGAADQSTADTTLGELQ